MQALQDDWFDDSNTAQDEEEYQRFLRVNTVDGITWSAVLGCSDTLNSVSSLSSCCCWTNILPCYTDQRVAQPLAGHNHLLFFSFLDTLCCSTHHHYHYYKTQHH